MFTLASVPLPGDDLFAEFDDHVTRLGCLFKSQVSSRLAHLLLQLGDHLFQFRFIQILDIFGVVCLSTLCRYRQGDLQPAPDRLLDGTGVIW